MKVIYPATEPVNILIGKDRSRNLYVATFDSRQISPRVSVGSIWIAHDRRYGRRFFVRVVETGYNDSYDLERILTSVRENPHQPFDARSLEYYCTEKAWLKMEGELKDGILAEVYDQPTALQTFLTPPTDDDNLVIAVQDFTRGFAIGNLRSGAKVLQPLVTLEDRFNGHRTLITGASGFGKSTFVRNVARYWIENESYGKIIDDLKGEYVFDIQNEAKSTVNGLCHHPLAPKNLYLLTTSPNKYKALQTKHKIRDIIHLQLTLDDIPPLSLNDITPHELSGPQKLFIGMYHDKPSFFRILMKKDPNGDVDTRDWHQQFKGFVVLTKEAEKKLQDDVTYLPTSHDFKHTFTPIHSVIRQLTRLATRPFITTSTNSCLPRLRDLLKQKATIVLDKSGLTDEDRLVISTVLADHLYRHNERHSSGDSSAQEKVIPFVYLVEEAHLLLSSDRAKEGSVFVNFAKTGRSFQIGLVAVTQRPSSVDPNILSQFDNFVTFRLTNEQDARDIVKAQSAFQGYEADIRSMPKGAAVTAFGEPTKVQMIQGFDWTPERSRELLSIEQKRLRDSSTSINDAVSPANHHDGLK